MPDWVPLKTEDTVLLSGGAEITLGTALVFTPEKHKQTLGKVAAIFFMATYRSI
ncbi:hypothetical protein NAF17_08055 [Mucilaginibacter sp. RB4R14]|uniref:hypothetical protein n=1 Tax=Mucilaginibacter aurantiaciroseus TaxID=2949308 RepID=UPI0020919779|nr:hypothetical protein [Mucilaginibacter aurantiaciroseus]MCO5935491.1 hypothetical protein [Mucilaginibacter aurantiaciroseus]